jgi:hypothetical protein
MAFSGGRIAQSDFNRVGEANYVVLEHKNLNSGGKNGRKRDPSFAFGKTFLGSSSEVFPAACQWMHIFGEFQTVLDKKAVVGKV